MRVLPLVAKKRALEPLSMKAEKSCRSWDTWSATRQSCRAGARLLGQPLLSRVPMPNTKAPSRWVLIVEIVGNSIIVRCCLAEDRDGI